MSPCPTCVERQANLGDPSEARWIGPDGIEYCSLHFIQAFGHGEPLVRIEGYEPPAKAEGSGSEARAEAEAEGADRGLCLMPCAALGRGIRQSAPHTGMPFVDAINNSPCGRKLLTSVNGVSVSAENLCIFHWMFANGQQALVHPVVQEP